MFCLKYGKEPKLGLRHVFLVGRNRAVGSVARWFRRGIKIRQKRGCMVMRNLAVGLLGFALCGQLVWSQVNTATISGTVRDASGAVLPGANVVVLNQDTGITRTVTSNTSGRYAAPGLGLGNYRVTAQQAGFQTQVRSGIALKIGRAHV